MKKYLLIKENPITQKNMEGDFRFYHLFPLIKETTYQKLLEQSRYSKEITEEYLVNLMDCFIDSPHSKIPKVVINVSSGVKYPGYSISVVSEQELETHENAVSILHKNIDMIELSYKIKNKYPEGYAIMADLAQQVFNKSSF